MFVFLFTLVGCPQGTDTDTKPDDSGGDTSGETGTPPVDADADGFPVETDCDDTNAGVNPDADEVCDSIDNDCDGLIDDEDLDEGIGFTWYTDADHDGYGKDGTERVACMPESNEVSFGGDCDDDNNDVFPGAQEVCDGGVDEDCDGLVDDADPDTEVGEFWFEDGDGDGFGAGVGLGGCAQPEGTVAQTGDCDDTNASISPAGKEICDAEDLDEDCDGGADDEDPNGTPEGNTPWYRDDDGDGYGVDTDQIYTCDGGSGYAAVSGDCEPADATIHPAATELCDGIDQDCDGTADNGAEGRYPDADGDGFGDGASIPSCDSSAGVEDHSDCDDTDAAINPLATEICSTVDEDCDGLVDDADDSLEADDIYIDNDGDSYGADSSAMKGCGGGPPLTAFGGDCDDTDPAISPGAVERYGNTTDEDCDGATTPVWEVCVGTNVPADYATIGEAVAAVEAAGGGTVCVAAGTYAEDVTLGADAAVVLLGEDPDTTEIDGLVVASAYASRIGQLSILGGVQVLPDDGVASSLTLSDLRVEGSGQPGLLVWFGAGGTLVLDLLRMDVTADAPSAGLQILGETCDDAATTDLTLTTSGVWFHDASYGVEVQLSGSNCGLDVGLDWSTYTDDDVAVRGEVSGGALTLTVDHGLLVGNTTGVSWETLFGGGSITGLVTNSMFYGGTADFGGSAHADAGYVWGTDPLLDTTVSPPLPGAPAINVFPTEARQDYWNNACIGSGCDYGAVEGG